MTTNPLRVALSRRRLLLAAAAGSVAAEWPATAFGRGYPDRPIRVVVGNPPGGINDQTIRAACIEAQKKLPQPLVVVNRPGAAGVVSFNEIKNASPEGYTIGVSVPPLWRQPILEDGVDYDPVKDFTYILNVSETIFAITVAQDSPFKTWADVLAYSRANPGRLSYAAPPGERQTAHILVEGMARKEGMKWQAVGYKGSAESIPAMLGGFVAFSMEPVLGVSPLVRAGKARMLAVASRTRLRSWPAVPTFGDLGYPITVDSPTGIAGPAHMAPEAVQAIHAAFKFAIEQPSFVAFLNSSDQSPRYMGPDDYTTYVSHAAKDQRDLLVSYGMARKK